MKLTREKIDEYRRLADELELEGREMLNLPDETIIASANGIGCASMPDALRNALDALHPSLILPSVIHDLQWEFSDGSHEQFHSSNEAFGRNGKKMADYNHVWYSPARYIVRHKSTQFRRILEMFGWKPYRDSYELHADTAEIEAMEADSRDAYAEGGDQK